jgi:inorganic pyrophosphatase
MLKKYYYIWLIGLTILILNNGCQRAVPGIAEEFAYNDLYTLDNGKDLTAVSLSTNPDGTVNAVVEIPAGTLAKWEVNGRLQDGSKPDDGKLRWEFENGKPRVIQYIGYPGNYGFIPSTLNADGDQLDILLLGPPLPRGALVTAKVIGVLKMQEKGEMNNKILAVTKDTPLFDVDDLSELDTHFPGVREIIEIWFAYYKGQAAVSALDWGNKEEAERIIKESMDGFVS